MRLIALALLLSGTTLAADLRQPTPDVFALTGVRVVTEPGRTLDAATIVIRDGIIEAVGQDIDLPSDARLIEFEREADQDPITVYPGLIETYLPISSSGEESDDDESTASPEGRHELIHPDRRLRAQDWPGDQLSALREAGFTTAVMAPADGLIRGQGLIANLGDGELSHNLLTARFAHYAAFDGRIRGRRFPNSLMGAVALVRQTLDDATWQQQARAAWQRNPAQARPQWLEGLDELAPVVAGNTPLVFHASDLTDTLRILEFTRDRQLDLVVIGHGEEYRRMDGLSARPVRHILPLNFPEPPDARDENDRNVSLEALRHWKNAPGNPAQLADADIPLMFTSLGLSQPKQIFKQLARAIEAGLSADQALAALTTEPAAWLGLDDRAGRIRPGYMANLIIVEGDLMVENPSINAVWIDGREHVLAALVPPAVDPAGTWSLTLGLGSMGDMEAVMVLTGPPTGMSGTLSVMGNESPFTDVKVSGEEVIASMDASRFGGSGTITMRLQIDGDRARGNGNGPYGEFTVRGQRTGNPDTLEVL